MKTRKMLLAGASLVAMGASAPALAGNCLGTITGNHTGGIYSWTSGNCTNNGTISNGPTGIHASSSVGTLTNSGTISGAAAGLLNDGTIGSLANSGLISANGEGIANFRSITRLTNSGSITGSTGIDAGAIGMLGNQAGGTISGHSYGVVSRVHIGTLANNGVITGSAAGLSNIGTVGQLSNTGTIAGRYGVYNTNSVSTIDNTGVVISTGHSLAIYSSGVIGQITNSGTITGWKGIGNDGALGTLNNSGHVDASNAAVFNTGSITRLTNTGSFTGTYGIANLGTIAALTNEARATISGGVFGIYNLGIIGADGGAMVNKGVISGATGLSNSGTIASLINSGTIISGHVAIWNFGGDLGPITNSGVIAGKIISTNTLTVNGGSGSTFGTLTGSDLAAKGTFHSDVVFGTGNTYLHDDVTGNVTVNTATLKVTDTVNVTGSYNQTGGALVVVGNGLVNVTGDATVNHTAIRLIGSMLAPGRSETVVASSGAGSYALSTNTVAALGYAATLKKVGPDLVVTVGQALYGGSTQTMANVINQNAGNSGLAPIINSLATMTPAQQGQALGQLKPNEPGGPAAAATTAIQVAGLVGDVIAQRGEQRMADAGSGMAAGSGTRASNAWIQTVGGIGSRDTTASVDGYDLKTWGLIFGADTHVAPEVLVGGALVWGRGWTNGLAGSAGDGVQVDSWQAIGYSAWRHGPWLVNGQVGVGVNQYRETRALTALNQAVGAQYGGHQYTAAADVAYAIPSGPVVVSPIAGLRWLRLDTGGYAESGGNAALSVAGSTQDQVESRLGAKLAWPTTVAGIPVIPGVKAAWIHDFVNGDVTTTATLGGIGFQTSTGLPQANGAAIGAGLTAEVSDTLALHAEYNGEFRADYRAHTGMIEATARF